MPQVTQGVLREDVLDKTMMLFWKNGFFNTSIDDIVAVSGLNRGAIYKHFGGKSELFLAMLKRYRLHVTPQLTLSLSNPHEGIKAIHNFLLQFMKLRNANKLPYGCFLIATASDLPSHNVEVSDFIKDFLTHLRQLFKTILESMKSRNEIQASVNISAVADYLLGNVFGLMTLCRSNAPKKVIENQINEVINQLTYLSTSKSN